MPELEGKPNELHQCYATRVPRSRFSRYLLRTTDVAAATAFYDVVLEQRRDEIIALPEPAIARGARPLWLGYIGVSEVGAVEAVTGQFLQRGAQRLGPPSQAGDVILQDPGGAVVALTNGAAESATGVVWHQLNTREQAVATANYSALFAWSFTEQLDLGALGRHHCFAFGAGESTAGAFSDIEGRPGVHAHWLFFFAVRALDVAVERVRALGGIVSGPMELGKGVRVAVCDDPQGAAFGLIEDHAPLAPSIQRSAR